MVAVGCETEPVSNNAEFMVFAQRVLDGRREARRRTRSRSSRTSGPSWSPSSARTSSSATPSATRASDGDVLTAYVHPPANKLGVLVHARGDGDQAYRLAMHIAASRRSTSAARDVPEAEIDAEREILAKQPDVQEKPERGAREDRRGPDPEVARGDRARGPGLDPRHEPPGRRRARRVGARGARVPAPRPWQSRRVTASPTPAPHRAASFKRVLLKLSGEALSGERDFGIDQERVESLADEVVGVHRTGRRARDRRRRREHHPRHGPRRGRAWTARRPTTPACSAASSTRSRSRTRSSGATPRRGCSRRSPSPRSPSRTSAAAPSATSRRAASSSSRPAPATRSSPPTRPRRCARSRSAPRRS